MYRHGKSRGSVPAGFTPEGLPVGVQIVGRDKEDFGVLQMAQRVRASHRLRHAAPAIA